MRKEKIVFTSLRYGEDYYNDTYEGEDLSECLRTLYLDINDYSDEDELRSDLEVSDEDWNSWKYWLECIEEMDTADFVLLSVYSINDKEFIYERDD